MKKVIAIKKGGYIFHVDLHYVAQQRATYYADKDSKDGDGTYEEIYKTEYEHTMTDSYDGIDWFENNMNWSEIPADFKRIAKSPKPPESPADIEWCDDVDLEMAEAA